MEVLQTFPRATYTRDDLCTETKHEGCEHEWHWQLRLSGSVTKSLYSASGNEAFTYNRRTCNRREIRHGALLARDVTSFAGAHKRAQIRHVRAPDRRRMVSGQWG